MEGRTQELLSSSILPLGMWAVQLFVSKLRSLQSPGGSHAVERNLTYHKAHAVPTSNADERSRGHECTGVVSESTVGHGVRGQPEGLEQSSCLRLHLSP